MGRGAHLLAALLILTALSPTLRAARAAEAKTLQRFHDPVIVTTGLLAKSPAGRTEGWNLYRVDSGRLEPILSQFDPVGRDGAVDVDAPREFELDANDELVFMAKDTGERMSETVPWPEGCDVGFEIEVVDPLDQGRGWAYALHCPGARPASGRSPYVAYDANEHRVRSSFYDVSYARGRNFFTGIRIGPAAGGTGANLLRQTRMRGMPTLHLLFTDVTLHFTEQTSIVEVDGVRNGDVRAVRRVRLSVDLGPLFPELPSGTAYTFHYLSSYVTPTRMGIPWLALKTLRDFCFENLMEFAPEVMPLRYWDGANPQGTAWQQGDGNRLELAEDHDWWVHSGAAGTMLHAFVIPDEWREWGIVRGTVFRDGPVPDDRRACDRDALFGAGYSLLHMTKLREARSYQLLQVATVLPRPYQPGDEAEPMAMLRAPVRSEVRRLKNGKE